MVALCVGLVQFAPGPSPEENFAKAFPLVETAARQGARLVALPEAAHYRGPREGLIASAESVPGPWTDRWGEVARALGIHILAGTLAERIPDDKRGRSYNTAPLVGPDASLRARYRKRNLFDVTLETGEIRESRMTKPGKEFVVADVEGWKVGILVCFDLRFGRSWEALRRAGAELVLLPSNFTRETGRAHWEILVRARAIEEQVFVAAPATWGRHAGIEIMTQGESMIVGPWGEILGRSDAESDAVVTASLDPARLTEVRGKIPLRKR